MGLYLFVVGVGVAVHEPWFDEAQSWLLARDASVWRLLTTYLRYEGHPPLWYLILKIPATLGLPYKSVDVVAAVIAAAGVLLLVLNREIPALFRALLPFTYFVAYQYTVVARSYVLVLPLMLAILSIYRKRRQRMWLFAGLLLLLSLVSLHGLSLAGALTAAYLFDLWPERRTLSRKELIQHAIAGALLLANVVMIGLILRPPHDLAIAPYLNFRLSLGAMARVAVTAFTDTIYPGALTALVVAVLAVWLYRRKTLRTASLLILSLLPISSVYYNAWHEGLFFIALVFSIFLAFTRIDPRTRTVADRRFDHAVLVLVALILLQHIWWTFRSLQFDIAEPYSGSEDAAAYIAEHQLERTRLFGTTFPALAVEPYFPRNIFANYRTSGGFSFWDWSMRTPWYYRPAVAVDPAKIRRWTLTQVAQSPDYILVSRKFPWDAIYSSVILASGRYERIRVFPGGLFWKTGIGQFETFELYRRVR